MLTFKNFDRLKVAKTKHRKTFVRNCISRLLILFLVCLSGIASSQEVSLSSQELKKLSLEELMNIDVTSVSKRIEKLNEVASAIQVITQKDIHNSGVKTLPEALRLATNLQVAQVNSSEWAISARGFNNVLANKLLVLIDGRTVYTPLYSGVFWDIQNLILEDIDRIEVISGPGGTLWGANAVNGVINIITKNSRDTKGLFAEALTGTNTLGLGSLRYGGQIKENFTYRVFGTGFKMDNTIESQTGSNAKDEWSTINGGLRFDWDPSEKTSISLQQNIYKARPNPYEEALADKATGDNILLRWNQKASEKFDLQFQAYYDNSVRQSRVERIESLKTYDLDLHSRLDVGKRNTFSFGTNLRVMDHKFNNNPSLQFAPNQKILSLYSLFIQDEVRLMGDRLKLTLGSKIEHNSYTGFEFQPNARVSYAVAAHQTLWGAISRAVKTPSRLDRDIRLYLDPNILFFMGGENFKSETVVAYELGWRSQPAKNVSFSLSSFYNEYDNIRSAEPPVPPATLPLVTLANGVKGKTYGAELSATSQVTNWWNLRAGYSYFKKELTIKQDSKDLNNATAESNDPSNQILIQSNIKFPAKFEFGTTMRYIDKLPKPYVPDYFALDLRLGWHLNNVLEFNLVGQNLLDKRHLEFIPATPAPRQIERSVYGKITLRY